MNFQQPILTPAEIVRLDTWAVELAEEARGTVHDAGKGDWRIGDGRSLIVHPGALFYDFAAGAGGRGALGLIKLLHNCDEAAASKLARAWLADHPGEGRLAHESNDDEDMARAADDAQRIAEIETLWGHKQPIEGTPAEIYLASRDLTPSCESLGFLPDMRGQRGRDDRSRHRSVGKARRRSTHLSAGGRRQVAGQAAAADLAGAARLGIARRRVAQPL